MKSSWKYQKIFDFVDITMGQSPKSEFYNFKNEGIPFLQGNRTFGNLYPTYDTWCSNPTKIANKDSVLMSVRAPVGDINIAPSKLCIGRGISSLSMKNSNNRFLYYLLKANQKKIVSTESGTVFGSVNKSTIENISVLVTSNEFEQLAIANILSSLDDKIELNQKINKNLEELAQTLYKQWFVDFEFPNEEGLPYKSSGGEMVESELGLIPKGWQVKRIQDIVETVLGGTPSRMKSDFWGPGYQWLKSGELNNSRIINGTESITQKGLDSSATKLMPKGSILIGITGYVGLVSMLEIEACANQSVVGIIPNSMFPRSFLYGLIKSEINVIALKQTGSAQQHINKNDINSHKVVIPNNHLVSKAGLILEPIHSEIAVKIFENEKLKKIRDLLLPKLMSGEIEVPTMES
jgi:type I restriction enzyme, S subunit